MEKILFNINKFCLTLNQEKLFPYTDIKFQFSILIIIKIQLLIFILKIHIMKINSRKAFLILRDIYMKLSKITIIFRFNLRFCFIFNNFNPS